MADATQTDLVENFRDAMRHVAATVYAVTAIDNSKRYGILATAVSSLSFEPPSVLVCVNRTASLHDPMERAERFCVNVLGLNNCDVAERFMLPRPDRFDVGDWTDELGVPVLNTAQSSLVCRTAHRQVFGTHTIFIGEVMKARHRDDATPLTYFDRDYIDISRVPRPGHTATGTDH